jgi:hypothetical protein
MLADRELHERRRQVLFFIHGLYAEFPGGKVVECEPAQYSKANYEAFVTAAADTKFMLPMYHSTTERDLAMVGLSGINGDSCLSESFLTVVTMSRRLHFFRGPYVYVLAMAVMVNDCAAIVKSLDR